MVSRAFSLALRGFQFFCVFIIMALVGNMIATGRSSQANAASNNITTISIPAGLNGTAMPSNATAHATVPQQYGNAAIVNFDMFVAAWGMLSLFYLILVTVNGAFTFHPALTLGLDVLNIFWFFIGAVATAALLGVHSCGDQQYVATNIVTRGSSNMEMRCHEAQASTAFLFFGLFAFILSSVLTWFSSRGFVELRSVGSGPAMSQVGSV